MSVPVVSETPPAGNLAEVNAERLGRRLRTERFLAWLPASVVTASGGVDLWLHEGMMHALHTYPLAIPLAIGVGSAINGVTTLLGGWCLSHNGALEHLHRAEPGQETPNQLKRAFWFQTAAGAALTVFGVEQPLVVGGYLVTAAIGTAAWHVMRRRMRRTLRKAIAGIPIEPAPGRQAIETMPPTPTALMPVGELVDLVGRWRDGVAGTGIVSKSELVNPLRHADGRISFTINGGPQGILLSAVSGAREQIASALRLSLPDANNHGGQDIVFDQPIGLGLHRGQLRGQIIDLTSATSTSQRVTEEIISAPGNPYSIRIGCYIDDGTPAYWDLADEDGAWSGAIIAGTGAGKSSLVDHIAYRARQLGFHVLYLDPTDGASSPIMKVHATWPALGMGYAMAAMRFVEDAATTRQKWMTMHDGVGKIAPGMIAPCAPGGTHPDPTCPCQGVVPPPMLIVVEECDLVFAEPVPGSSTKQAVAWGKLAKRIRKLCMGMIVVTQLPEIKAFGNDDLLRSNVAVRNLLAMHIASNTGGTLIPGLPYSPRLIPKKKGRALMCGQATRKMEIQLDRMARREDAPQLGGVGPWAEDLYEDLPSHPQYPADAVAAQRWMPFDGPDAATASRDQARADFAAILAGVSLNTPGINAGPQLARSLSSSEVPIPEVSLSWPAPVTVSCPPPTVEELEAMYTATSSGTRKPNESTTTTEKGTADTIIWQLLLAGTTRKGDLIAESSYSESQVRNALNALMSAGKVRRDSHGEYKPLLEG